jgi:hypothetical protein
MQGVDICETIGYKIVNVSKSTYMLYIYDSKKGYQFLPHGNKGTHKLRNKRNQMFNHWLVWKQIQCYIKWRALEMVEKMCNVYCLNLGKISRNETIR